MAFPASETPRSPCTLCDMKVSMSRQHFFHECSFSKIVHIREQMLEGILDNNAQLRHAWDELAPSQKTLIMLGSDWRDTTAASHGILKATTALLRVLDSCGNCF